MRAHTNFIHRLLNTLSASLFLKFNDVQVFPTLSTDRANIVLLLNRSAAIWGLHFIRRKLCCIVQCSRCQQRMCGGMSALSYNTEEYNLGIIHSTDLQCPRKLDRVQCILHYKT